MPDDEKPVVVPTERGKKTEPVRIIDANRYISHQTSISVAILITIVGAAIIGTFHAASLSSEVQHNQESLRELRLAIEKSQQAYADTVIENQSQIRLIQERMLQDDRREERDTNTLVQLREDVNRLEIWIDDKRKGQ